MRVTRLELQAFGPFKNKEIIDFDKFGEEGLFLISGQTGSGKTSIFDAISYALFDSSSTGDRNEAMLRYAGADLDTDTYVKLSFVYRSKAYTIERYPEYLRSKLRGQGTTLSKKSVELKLPDGQYINGVNEVNAYIKDLLGINKDQFNQIMMLAQGKFMKFLKASNDDKAKLFREIFTTEKFNKLENNIREKYSKINSDLSVLMTSKENTIENFIVASEYYDDFIEAKLASGQELIDFMHKYRDTQETEILKLTEKIDVESNIISKDKALLDKVYTYIETKDKLLKAIEDLEKIKLDFEDSRKEYEGLGKNEKLVIDLNRTLDRLNDEKEKLKIIEDLKKNISSLEDEINSHEKNLLEIETDIKDLTSQFDKIEEFIKENSAKKEEKIVFENKKDKLEEKVSNLKEIKILIDDLEDVIKDHKVFENTYRLKKDELEKKQAEYNHLEDLYFEYQAGILASKIEEGKACPVCGSTHHPNKASLSDSVPDKEDLDQAKDQVNLLSQEYEEIKLALINKNNEKENLEKQIENKLNKENIKRDDLDKALEDKKADFEQVKNQISDTENILTDLETKEEDKIGLKNKISEKEKNLKSINEHLISLREKLNSDKVRKEEEIKKISYDNPIKLDEELENVSLQLEKLDQDIKNIKTNYQTANNKYISKCQEIDSLKDSLNEKYNLDPENIELSLKEKSEILKDLREDLTKLKANLITNNKNLDLLEKIEKDLGKKEKDYQNYAEIYKLLTGQVSGVGKVKFETFIQLKYFDQVLQTANKRLYEMTQGKFSLKRKVNPTNKNSQMGLDIEVIDHHNQTIRDVNTLSGGEAFQASLSLALGLSDIVQMNAGGIQLDSMFIDEGFGTLDTETLASVMKNLSKISNSNKLVGIISHVDILKEQIDKQILVEKNKSGYSTVVKQIYWL